MSGYIKRIINVLTRTPKSVFLIDGLGAGLTTIFLIGVLKTFNEYFGMPQQALTILSIIALILTIYSFSCFAFSYTNPQKSLRLIIVANFTYCILTAGLVIFFYKKLTPLGITYFVGEVLVIGGLVYIELKALKASRKYIRESL